MEITEFKKKLKTGRASIKLLDTGFSQLTRKITSSTGANYTTVGEGDSLSKEAIVSLNTAQLSLKTRYENLFSAYNSWINGKISKIPALDTFDYEFSAIEDYSSGYEAGITSADYYILTSIVNAEKELYEAGNYWFLNNLKANIEDIKEWSKTQMYGSCVESAISKEFESDTSLVWEITSSPSGSVGMSIYPDTDQHDKKYIKFTNLTSLSVGETASGTIRGEKTVEAGETGSGNSKYFTWYATASWSVSRVAMFTGDTEGKIVFGSHTFDGNADDSINGSAYVSEYTGVTSPYFDTDSPSFEWLNSRIIL